eukprot:m.190487 g.190487  ORF g.190487 m.190487 type:complete len:684 (+) comp16943_c0_seq1:13-2064(+)
MVAQQLDFHEAIKDGPGFRWQLKRVEDQIQQQSAHLERVSKACDTMVSKGHAYERAVTGFITELAALGEDAAYRQDPTLPQALQRFTTALLDLQANRTVLLQQAQATVADSLRRHIAKDVKGVTDLKTMYHKMSADLDSARQRRAGCSASKPHELQDAENMLQAQQAGFNHIALDYVYKLNMLLATEKDEIVEKSLAYLNSHRSYYTQGHDMMSDLEPHFREVTSKLSDRQALKASEQKRMEKELHDIQSEHLSPSPGASVSSKEQQLVKEGYLFKRTTNAFKSWTRRYFLLQGGQLLYIHRDKEEPPKAYVEDLRICTVKPFVSDNVDRTFCFEVITPAKTHVLQAESQAEKDDWIACLQAGIGAALDIHHHMDRKEPETQSPSQQGDRQREQQRQELQDQIRQVPGNDTCADCGDGDPTWVAINMGVALCINCSGIHRSLGSHLSKVRSLTLDRIDPEICQVITRLGNTRCNNLLEADTAAVDEAKAQFRNSSGKNRDILEHFIVNKYLYKKYLVSPKEADVLNDALLEAAAKGDLPAASSALLAGADVNIHNSDGMSPLMVAAAEGRPIMTELLILNGAERDHQEPKQQQTAVHLATVNGHYTVVCLLVKAKSAVDIKDIHGKTATDYALEAQSGELVTVLRMVALQDQLPEASPLDDWIKVGMADFEQRQSLQASQESA